VRLSDVHYRNPEAFGFGAIDGDIHFGFVEFKVDIHRRKHRIFPASSMNCGIFCCNFSKVGA
jgi:hypothetical protein